MKDKVYPENKRKSQGIRARRTTRGIIELWLGEPGQPESECFMCVNEFYLPGILHTLENIRKAPVIDSTMVYGQKHS